MKCAARTDRCCIIRTDRVTGGGTAVPGQPGRLHLTQLSIGPHWSDCRTARTVQCSAVVATRIVIPTVWVYIVDIVMKVAIVSRRRQYLGRWRGRAGSAVPSVQTSPPPPLSAVTDQASWPASLSHRVLQPAYTCTALHSTPATSLTSTTTHSGEA